MPSYRVHNIRSYEVDPRAINCMSYERDLQKLAVGRSDSIEIWDLSYTPFVEKTIRSAPDSTVEDIVWCGNRLFSTGFQGTLIEYDMVTLTPKTTISVTPGPAWCLAINKRKTYLAVGTEEGYISTYRITPEGPRHDRWFNVKEARIMCIGWDGSGNFIVSGSYDSIQIWNVQSGQLVRVMHLDRSAKSVPTIVWSLVVCDDFTIISGDSRGRMCFWNGRNGSMLSSIHSHKADILSVCLNETQDTVYAAGTDPSIATFKYVNVHQSKSSSRRFHPHHLPVKRWVKSMHRRLHTHDVRALAVDGQRILSGGLDCYLIISIYPPRRHFKYPPILQYPCIQLAPKQRYVMMRHSRTIDLWRLGDSNFAPEAESEEELPLIQDPVKLLELKTRGDEAVTCCAVSSDGAWLAYSTSTRVHFYSFMVVGDVPMINKVRYLPVQLEPAHQMAFTPDSCRLVVASQKGNFQVMAIDLINSTVECSLPTYDEEEKDAVHLLQVSSDGRFAVTANSSSLITVFNIPKRQRHCTLPRYRCQPSAIGIQPKTNIIVAVYVDQRIVEFSIKDKEFTQFSRNLTTHHPHEWSNRLFPTTQVSFDPLDEDLVVLHDDEAICVIDKSKRLPEPKSKLQRVDPPLHSEGGDASNSQGSQSWRNGPNHAFYISRRYKHLVYFGSLCDDEVVSVEVTPESIFNKLPAALHWKKFGV